MRDGVCNGWGGDRKKKDRLGCGGQVAREGEFKETTAKDKRGFAGGCAEV